MGNRAIHDFLVRTGLYGLDQRLKRRLSIVKAEMSHPPYSGDIHRETLAHVDVVRYAAIALALRRIDRENVPGHLAEVGVFQGELSAFLARVAPERTLHLFDTFAGFVPDDADRPDMHDDRFRDTSVAGVRARIGDRENVRFHVGVFPETASELGDERFAFVMLDVDRYQPTLAGLEVFYPRLSAGGYLFVHDYNSPESEYGVSRAVDEFLQSRPERIVELPDPKGTALFRKA